MLLPTKIENQNQKHTNSYEKPAENLHAELIRLRKKEKQLTQKILEKLQEMEDGRKYLQMGYSSLFDYLVRGLGYSESSAYRRQSCLRLSKELPEVKQKLDSGALTPAGLSMAFRHMKGKSTEEKKQILQKIENKATREIKKILSQREVAPPIQIRKTEYVNKVILRLELTHEQNQKLEKLKALKSHSGNLEQLLECILDRELKSYDLADREPSRPKNNRFENSRFKKMSGQK